MSHLHYRDVNSESQLFTPRSNLDRTGQSGRQLSSPAASLYIRIGRYTRLIFTKSSFPILTGDAIWSIPGWGRQMGLGKHSGEY